MLIHFKVLRAHHLLGTPCLSIARMFRGDVTKLLPAEEFLYAAAHSGNGVSLTTRLDAAIFNREFSETVLHASRSCLANTQREGLEFLREGGWNTPL